MSDAILCVLGHGTDDEGKPVEAQAEHGFLCRHHRKQLDSTTYAIRELWFDLALVLEANSAPKDTTPKTRHLKAAEAPAPANLDALALRDHRNGAVLQSGDIPAAPAVVASWLQLVAEERPLTSTLSRSMLGQLDLLERHHEWMAQQDWIDDYVSEFGELRRALTQAVRDRRYEPVGRCPLPTEDKPRCNGDLGRENGADVIRCRSCGAAWVTPQERARLSVMMDEKKRVKEAG